MAKKKTAKKRFTFVLEAEPGKSVSVAGDFNGWDVKKTPLKDKDGTGVYKATKLLEPGVYEYKFYVDGNWCVDPENPNFTTNEMGTLNSVLEV